jgi:TonB-dependent starch-binding outer membrane protein SusC
MQSIAIGKGRAHAPDPCQNSNSMRGLFVVTFLLLALTAFTQNISLDVKQVPLVKVFSEIQKQTPYSFIYAAEDLKAAHPVTMKVTSKSLSETLVLLFEGQPLSYSVNDQFIVVKRGNSNVLTTKTTVITGKVVTESGEPLVGATVSIRGSARATATGSRGEFHYSAVNADDILTVSNVGFQSQEIAIAGRSYIIITLRESVSALDETVVMAYGTTTKRLATGSISKVSGAEISKQPVSNALAAMQGRVPGMTIVQSSGVPGAAFKVRIRGQNSLRQGSDPLYVIDGVPFALGNEVLNQITNAAGSGSGGMGGLSAMNLVNPADIESIEILKDADATAIYGSRGANGVVLITTKKGIPGATRVTVNTYTGFSQVTRTMDMLHTQQYLQMRREAFANDGITPTQDEAPDLFTWDTTRYTDFKKMLIGGKAHTSDIQLSLSGGNAKTQFLMGAGYHKETTVFPGDQNSKRASFLLNLGHSSGDQKFTASLNTSYSANRNKLVANDLSSYINLAPHIHLYDSLGNLNWMEGGIPFRNLSLINPLGYLYKKYTGDFDNLISNVKLSYQLSPGLSLRINLGYNLAIGDENQVNPSTSIDPNEGSLPFSSFANNRTKGWILEPQLEYKTRIGKGVLDVLTGGTGQETSVIGFRAEGMNYTSDLLLNNLNAAGEVMNANSAAQYRYIAVFGRINYNWQGRYVLNFSGRRDGSSRFGPGRRFSNFGAGGAAWIFSKELKNLLPFVSYGKLRASYGSAGNDQIGNYKYLDTWTPTLPPYQGVPALLPSALYNPDFAWERSYKLEGALDLGFFDDQLLVNASYYRNRSGNQLINYTLPIQTGFSSILKNIDAVIENKGWELAATGNVKLGKQAAWESSLQISIPKNRLVSFPGLASTSYARTYVIGQPVSVINVYHSFGIDQATGVYAFDDVNKDGKLNGDDFIHRNYEPKVYGGFRNTFRYKNFELEGLFEFKKSMGNNYLYTLGYNVPGFNYSNQPVIVMSRWQKPGDVTDIQRFTASASSEAFIRATENLISSDAVYTDASYLRLKNVNAAYTLPGSFCEKLGIRTARVYLQGQNLFTISSYVGADPENQNIYVLPPLRTLTAGIEVKF